MNDRLLIDTESCYSLAESKAAQYFAALYEQVNGKSYEAKLKEDIKKWEHMNRRNPSWLSRLLGHSGSWRSQAGQHDQRYINWLEKQGKLDAYLERSVSYIYLRDLGKRLDQPATQAKISKVVSSLKKQLMHTEDNESLRFISLAGAYRWAQKENVELAVIWVIDKLKQVAEHLPEEMNAEHAQRKLIKIIVGVVMHAMEEISESASAEERAQLLDKAIRLGYCYGLTYPFIDDLLDSKALTEKEKLEYSDVLRTALSTGVIPDSEQWSASDKPMLRFIYTELSEAFQYVKHNQSAKTRQLFFEQAYIFFHAQELDRIKELSHGAYTNEQLYLPIILKSASSRLIARFVLDTSDDEDFEKRTFYYGIYNQLADDFADMFDDQEAGAVTPYTYYLTYREQRSDLINPFELYWAVIAHLLHHVYHSDPSTRNVILGRALGGLKRFKAKHGAERYAQIMNTFAGKDSPFHTLIQRVAERADDVDFLDKLVRDQLVEGLKDERRQKQLFSQKVSEARKQINDVLLLSNNELQPSMKQQLIDAANYSLEGGGKRLRPIMSWVIGIDEFGLSPKQLMPLLRSLEYMHTASLIIDDLPTQDNAPSRRGRPTLHTIHNSATAELTSLLLMQRAVYEQASLTSFDTNVVLAMMRYSAKTAEQLCIGQAMDLSSQGQDLTLEQLNEICFYKTAIAFEASLVMPAILAGAEESRINALKAYAYHAGIAFQIRDDLLDSSGDASMLGKPVGLDMQNDTSTFVTVLGQDEAQKAMWDHYCSAVDALQQLQPKTSLLTHVLNYIVHRDR